MKTFLLPFFGAALLAGCASTARLTIGMHPPAVRPSWSAHATIKSGIDSLLADTLFPPAAVGVQVVSVESGEILYSLNPEYLFLPASNEKLLTSATAVETLGEGFSFVTRAWFDTTISPRIYLKGSGDPLLTSTDLDTLAHRAALLLPSSRRWTLCADLSLFDDLSWGKGWMWDDEPSSDAMYITPLSVNGNCIQVSVVPGSAPGDSAVVSLDPTTGYVTLQNTAVTVSDSPHIPLDVSRNWRDRTNTITVKGEIARAGHEVKTGISIWQPEWYALTIFRQKLEAMGVQCEGMIGDTVPGKAIELTRVMHGLDTVLTYMNKVSDNLSAENLLRTIAAAKYPTPASAVAGTEAVMEFLASKGFDTTKIVVADGSGVSRYNLVPPATLVRLLCAMATDKEHFPFWVRTLPVAGEDGTLSGRMKGTAAEHNVRAKTGTLDGVSTLSGYARSVDGRLLAFSIMMQGFPGNPREYRKVQDRICAFLCGLNHGSF